MVFHNSYTILHSHNIQAFQFLHILANTSFLFFVFHGSHSNVCEVCGLDLQVPDH